MPGAIKEVQVVGGQGMAMCSASPGPVQAPHHLHGVLALQRLQQLLPGAQASVHLLRGHVEGLSKGLQPCDVAAHDHVGGQHLQVQVAGLQQQRGQQRAAASAACCLHR